MEGIPAKLRKGFGQIQGVLQLAFLLPSCMTPRRNAHSICTGMWIAVATRRFKSVGSRLGIRLDRISSLDEVYYNHEAALGPC